ncbi:MAG: hypothetical protein HQM01_00460 [Magnetococcales bacterium]|nr:hypothetical protein [Magnetococcales bacterium]
MMAISNTPEPALTVAFASGDGVRVDAHFGTASRFVLHDIRTDGTRFIAERYVEGQEEHEARIARRVAALRGCRVLFCVAVGESARRRLAEAGITAVVVEPGSAVASLARRLADPALRGRLLPRGVTPTVENRYEAMLAAGWDE